MLKRSKMKIQIFQQNDDVELLMLSQIQNIQVDIQLKLIEEKSMLKLRMVKYSKIYQHYLRLLKILCKNYEVQQRK